jgi:glycerol-3-phosphate acyltransferase PlsX
MRIAVDVMGGDHGCSVVIEGVRLALREIPSITELFLVGHEHEIKSALARQEIRDPRLHIVHASEVLTMEDKPVVGLRKKKDCSILKAVELVKQGRAEAVISPGNTGGVVAASTLRLRPLPGLDRPGIAAVMPAPQNEFVLLDAGANIDCKPIHLVHYAIMGHVYAQHILGLNNPRVGMLSVGTEDIKGNDLTLESLKLCRRVNLNFIGNVEGHDLFSNRVDVVVCDGFVGNVVLKTCESLAINTFAWLKRELTRSPLRRLGAFLARSAFHKIKVRMNPDTYGGAPLLGLNGMVMIAHGSAREQAIKNALRVTTEILRHRLNSVISEEINRANQRLKENLSNPDPVSVIA